MRYRILGEQQEVAEYNQVGDKQTRVRVLEVVSQPLSAPRRVAVVVPGPAARRVPVPALTLTRELAARCRSVGCPEADEALVVAALLIGPVAGLVDQAERPGSGELHLLGRPAVASTSFGRDELEAGSRVHGRVVRVWRRVVEGVEHISFALYAIP